MRFVPSGKCKSGERKLKWNKRGKRGKPGAEGPSGSPGDGSTDLLALIQEQAAAIEALQAQLGLLAAQTQALCAQLSAVTGQADALEDAIAGLGLGGVVPVGLLLDIPALPAPLGPFSCPG